MNTGKFVWAGVVSTGILVTFASIVGVSALRLQDWHTAINIFGETVTLFGGGIYAYQTVSQAYQVIAHDLVNLFVALPVYVLTYWLMKKDYPVAPYLFAATALYFAFTFGIYTFFAVFNDLFLVYVTILGINFYIVLNIVSRVSRADTVRMYGDRYPKSLLANYLVVVSSLMALFWIFQALPTVLGGSEAGQILPVGTTLVPHAIDLAFLLPIVLVAGCTLYSGHAAGYIAASIVPLFLVIMMSSVVAKGVILTVTGIEPAIEMIVLMGLFLLTSMIMLIVNLVYTRRAR